MSVLVFLYVVGYSVVL